MFKLSATLLPAHGNDIKCVVAIDSRNVATSSRDGTAAVWTRDSATEWRQRGAFTGHNGFVNSLAFVPPTRDFPRGLVASGGMDMTVQLWDWEAAGEDAKLILVEHSANVCYLSVAPNGNLLSSSWDSTAIVWHENRVKHRLKGHQASVWCVVGLGNDQYATCSADKSIIIWQGSSARTTFPSAHADVPRSLCYISGMGLLSAGNDAVVKLWSLDGKVQKEMHGHNSFVYKVLALDSATYASSGEDRTIRIWQNGECIQAIQYPALSVWSIDALPNGDLVAGGSDGIARVFTPDAERAAPAEALRAYEENIQSQTISKSQLGDLNKDKLGSPADLAEPGKKEGEVKMIRKDATVVEAYQWSASAAEWVRIGEVVDAIGSDRKQTFDGKEWDYVFDVAMGEGEASLKLPFNANENPYMAAQRFIERNELPQNFLEQIAGFIISNAKPTEIGGGATMPGNADPFTGTSRYVSQQPQQQQPPQQAQEDSLLPLAKGGYTFFQTLSAGALSKKLKQLNDGSPLLGEAELDAVIEWADSLASNAGIPESAAPEIARLLRGKMLASAASASATTTAAATAATGTASVAAIVVPALDLLRCLLLRFDLSSLGWTLPEYLDTLRLDSAEAADAVVMLGLRTLCNLFKRTSSRALMAEALPRVLELAASALHRKPANRNVRVAGMTLYANYAIHLLYESDGNAEGARKLFEAATGSLVEERDAEAFLRGLVTLGSLVGSPQLIPRGEPHVAESLAIVIEAAGVLQTSAEADARGRIDGVCAAIRAAYSS